MMTLKDLSDEENHAWETRNAALVMDYLESNESTEEFLNYNIVCQHCRKASKAREYTGTLYKAKCPRCGHEFEPTVEQLCKSLYFTSFN